MFFRSASTTVSARERAVLTRFFEAVRTSSASAVVSAVDLLANEVSMVALLFRMVVFSTTSAAFATVSVVEADTLLAVDEDFAPDFSAPKTEDVLTAVPLAMALLIAFEVAADFVARLLVLVTVAVLTTPESSSAATDSSNESATTSSEAARSSSCVKTVSSRGTEVSRLVMSSSTPLSSSNSVSSSSKSFTSSTTGVTTTVPPPATQLSVKAGKSVLTVLPEPAANLP